MRGWNKRGIILLALCAITVMAVSGCGSHFDASGYVKAVLDLNFQGDTAKAMEMMDGVTIESLDEQHQLFVSEFVENNIASQIDMGEIKNAKFRDLTAKIFSTMRYDVGKAKETGGKEYEVPVEIQPSDVFIHFQEMTREDSQKIADKVKSGGYEGSDEEIAAQVLRDIANHAYELLDTAYTQSNFGEKETVILNVKADKSNEYSIDGEDMENLVVKILRLDEIQG